mmetsp:Transcript_25960/g.59823  ORF Transcript_25960/g.59823 Transcript_25960/m.59823 type:complete len:431 (+) Transcript_25960:99-1391(+)
MSWRSLPISSDELSLDATLGSGQSFRWLRDGSRDVWVGILGSFAVRLKQSPCALFFQIVASVIQPRDGISDTDQHEPVLTEDRARALQDKLGTDWSLDELMVAAHLSDFFQLEVCLFPLLSRWAEEDEHFALRHGTGKLRVRALCLSPFEALVCFICSEHNNIPRVSLMVDRLCREWGDRIVPVKDNGEIFYLFPTLNQLLAASEDDFRRLGFGFRAPLVVAAVHQLASLGGVAWLRSLSSLTLAEARTRLMSLRGVGPKVADCVCLCSLRFHSAVPIDVHMWRVVTKMYCPQLGGARLNRTLYERAVSDVQRAWGPYAGWKGLSMYTSCLAPYRGLLSQAAPTASQASPRRVKAGPALQSTVCTSSAPFSSGSRRRKLASHLDSNEPTVQVRPVETGAGRRLQVLRPPLVPVARSKHREKRKALDQPAP